ncbi:XisI protein [Candidatus Chloroploca sp. Khr17]|uniref:XisI protein n=1 Tax=Candidatus Chloroploca sp. Khr17 TaxID=2496869 RepID=UPI00101DB9A8|nr:XisI protein [Candidatus Chloroploca sp. Khr17]
MEKIAHYRAILERMIAEEAARISTHPEVEVCQICDPVRHHYQLLYLGWHGPTRVFTPMIHLRIHHGKVWIEHDGTEEGIAMQLLAAGIPRDEIVLAFYSPQKRPFTEFAVA